jgi:hypothetical protein
MGTSAVKVLTLPRFAPGLSLTAKTIIATTLLGKEILIGLSGVESWASQAEIEIAH